MVSPETLAAHHTLVLLCGRLHQPPVSHLSNFSLSDRARRPVQPLSQHTSWYLHSVSPSQCWADLSESSSSMIRSSLAMLRLSSTTLCLQNTMHKTTQLGCPHLGVNICVTYKLHAVINYSPSPQISFWGWIFRSQLNHCILKADVTNRLINLKCNFPNHAKLQYCQNVFILKILKLQDLRDDGVKGSNQLMTNEHAPQFLKCNDFLF